jgi:uncharacterized protein
MTDSSHDLDNGRSVRVTPRAQIVCATEGYTLAGTLYSPAGDGPFPTIVVVHSASAGRQDSPAYLYLVQVMTAIGVAVYVYDRRDVGMPAQTWVHPGYMALGRDVLAVVRMLTTRAEVDAARIGLWGISQGGWVAPAACVQGPDEIAFMILVSSSGVDPAAQMVYAVPHVLRAVGYDAQVAAAGAHLRALVDRCYQGEVPRETVQAQLDVAKDQPWFRHLYLEATLPAALTGRGWDNERHFDPGLVFRQITVPLLLVYGEDDPWIPVEESITIWRTALTDAGNTRAEIHRIPHTGHMMLVDEPAYSDDETFRTSRVSPIYTHLLQDFVRRVVRSLQRTHIVQKGEHHV